MIVLSGRQLPSWLSQLESREAGERERATGERESHVIEHTHTHTRSRKSTNYSPLVSFPDLIHAYI